MDWLTTFTGHVPTPSVKVKEQIALHHLLFKWSPSPLKSETAWKSVSQMKDNVLDQNYIQHPNTSWTVVLNKFKCLSIQSNTMQAILYGYRVETDSKVYWKKKVPWFHWSLYPVVHIKQLDSGLKWLEKTCEIDCGIVWNLY